MHVSSNVTLDTFFFSWFLLFETNNNVSTNPIPIDHHHLNAKFHHWMYVRVCDRIRSVYSIEYLPILPLLDRKWKQIKFQKFSALNRKKKFFYANIWTTDDVPYIYIIYTMIDAYRYGKITIAKCVYAAHVCVRKDSRRFCLIFFSGIRCLRICVRSFKFSSSSFRFDHKISENLSQNILAFSVFFSFSSGQKTIFSRLFFWLMTVV